MALNDFACVASPVLETNVISPPSYKTSKHSQNISGGHRKTRCPHALRENWSLKCRSVASWSSLPTGRNHQITSNLTVKSPSEEPQSSHRRLYQRYRPGADIRALGRARSLIPIKQAFSSSRSWLSENRCPARLVATIRNLAAPRE